MESVILWCADAGETLLCVCAFYDIIFIRTRMYKRNNHNFRIPCGWKYACRKVWEKLVCRLADADDVLLV